MTKPRAQNARPSAPPGDWAGASRAGGPPDADPARRLAAGRGWPGGAEGGLRRKQRPLPGAAGQELEGPPGWLLAVLRSDRRRPAGPRAARRGGGVRREDHHLRGPTHAQLELRRLALLRRRAVAEGD